MCELLETVDGRLATIQVENEKNLEQMRQNGDEKLQGTLEARLGESYKQVSDRLEQVYKGLGEMDADQLAETTMSRAHRTLRRVRVADAEQAATVFDLLMGNDVAPRKDFIIAGQGLDLSRVDV